MIAAEYICPANAKSYALGFDFYTHFTSPIRRYADLTVHRVLNSILKFSDETYIFCCFCRLRKFVNNENGKT